MRKKYYIDKRVFKTQKTNPFLSQAEVYDLLDIVSQLVAGSVPGQPVIPYIFGNGVLQQGNNVGLGGSFNQDTILDGNQHVFNIFDLAQFNVTSFDISMTTLSGDLFLDSVNDVIITSTNNTTLQGQDINYNFTGTHNFNVLGSSFVEVGAGRNTLITGDEQVSVSNQYILQAQLIDTYGEFRNENYPWYLNNGVIDMTNIFGGPLEGNGHYFNTPQGSSAMILIEDSHLASPLMFNIDTLSNTQAVCEMNGSSLYAEVSDFNSLEQSGFNINPGSIGINAGEAGVYNHYLIINQAGITIGDSINNIPYTIPVTDGLNGQVLITDGAGNVSWGSSPSSVTADNGLTLNGTVVELGGQLDRDTTISGPYDFIINTVQQDIFLEGANIAISAFNNSLDLFSSFWFNITCNGILTINTERLRIQIPGELADLRNGDILHCVDQAQAEFKYTRQTKSLVLDIVGLNDPIIGLGQSDKFLRIPEYLQQYHLRYIEASTHTDGGTLDLGIQVDSTNYTITLNPSHTYNTIAINNSGPMTPGELIKMSLINPSGPTRTGLSIILVFENA